MPTVAETIVTTLADLGVTTFWGVVGDALNPVTDAVRREERIEWIGVRHEEVGAFAAGAQAQLTGTLGVCLGTVGPGSLHLLNGLYDARKSHAPLLAICGQVPLAELGSEFFQEVDNDAVFRDVAVYCRTLTSPDQLRTMLDQALQRALTERGVAVLTLPGDIGGLDAPGPGPHLSTERRPVVPDPHALEQAAALLADAGAVTLLVGAGARHARAEVLALADRLAAPMVLTLKAKEGLEHDNPFAVGQSGLIGNPAAARAFDRCDALLMVGTDFPYSDWYPTGKTVIQIDERSEHLGRRTDVSLGIAGDARLGAQGLLERLTAKSDRGHLDDATGRYAGWVGHQRRLVDPDYDTRGIVQKVRTAFDDPDRRIRPEAVAAALDRQAADDAIFTSDTGMSTVWLSRFVTMRGTRRLLGSYNLGSMANAMPQALGAQALDRTREVVAFCGDGGLTMLLGDLITAVAHELPVRLVVFNNGRLGMVKLEQEQAGLPEFGTKLGDVDLAAIARAVGLQALRVERAEELDEAARSMFAVPGPSLLDVVTNPDEVSLPPKVTRHEAWGFAIAKLTETLESREA
ncbi:MAG: ubiquinone-dependent pyruvate dehydrogenase [Solirubrobacterales bacterium]|nr:ubiquinone-dependent pyruvate dehydrogenase [Solirubrobacterales bacterium]